MQDEYANHVDAGGYTMPLIAETLSQANTFRQQFGQAQNATWNQMASNVLVLRENGVTLEFTTMNGSAVVKQADVVLDTYPLSYTSHYSQQDSLNDLDYVSSHQCLLQKKKLILTSLDSMRTSSRLMALP